MMSWSKHSSSRTATSTTPCEQLGKINGSWVAVPANCRQSDQRPCSSIDLMKQHAGIDVQAIIRPATGQGRQLEHSITFLREQRPARRLAIPFGIGLGTTTDNVDTAGAIFHSFGAVLVDAKANITVKSDPVRQALDYYKRLMAFLPP